MSSTDVFVAGQDGVHTFRIPAIVAAPGGALLVFCEARKESLRDASPTDLVLRRSLDGGATWLPLQTLVAGTGRDAVMNPVAVVDNETGEVLLLCCVTNRPERGEHRRHLLMASADQGATWSAPRDIGAAVQDYDDTFVTGPGCGIQMRTGRLVVPGYTSPEVLDGAGERGFRARVLVSDDHGRTWRLGRAVEADANECQVAERSDGALMLNMRQGAGECCRAVALSVDGGASWGPVAYDRGLPECPCQASLLRWRWPEGDAPGILAFANPDNRGERFGIERTRMTVRLSFDEGRTWPVARLIHAGPSSYSGLVRLDHDTLGLVFEGGTTHRREWLRFCRLSLAWLGTGDAAAEAAAEPPA